MERIVVGMSGGVDSFATALQLQREGYDVTGVMLDLWQPDDSSRLEFLCHSLGISLIHHDGMKLFRRMVVKSFVNGYLAGITPSPCCICNSYVKWNLLIEVADSLGINRVATGHYVRLVAKGGYHYVRKGIDDRKDQSYFLWGVSQEVLRRAMTPLGGWTKEEVKAFAAANGFVEMARKSESMGVCFLQGYDYRDFVAGYAGTGQVCCPGDILDSGGKVIGRHEGILNYTIGQKRGLPLRDGLPLYVSRIDAVNNTVVADIKSGLWTDSIEVEGVKVARQEDLFAGDVEVKVRGIGLNPPGYITVKKMGMDELHINLASPAWAVAPGQPVSFYRGELVIGGGIVKK